MSEKEKENISIEDSVKSEEGQKAEKAPLKDSVKFENFVSTEDEARKTAETGEIELKSVPSEEYEKVKKELAETKELLLRVAADFENYKKRASKEKEDLIKFSNESILRDLLETADNLELTLLHSRQAETRNEDIIKGFEITLKGFMELLKRYGVTPLDMSNLAFDPNFHEAIAVTENETVPAGHIIRVERKGYMLRDRLLRAALVVVSRGKPAKEDENETGDPDKRQRCIAEPEPAEEKEKE